MRCHVVLSLAIGSLALVAVTAGCADDTARFPSNVSGGSGGSAGSTSTHSGAGGAGGAGARGGGGGGPGGAGGAAGAASQAEPACDAPMTPPSGGSCVTLSDDVRCNPVTNEPCSEVCGRYGPGLYQCYTTTSHQPLCGDCDPLICAGGLECPAEEGFPGGNRCAKYCCDDGDCGSGECYKEGISAGTADVGICLINVSP